MCSWRWAGEGDWGIHPGDDRWNGSPMGRSINMEFFILIFILPTYPQHSTSTVASEDSRAGLYSLTIIRITVSIISPILALWLFLFSFCRPNLYLSMIHEYFQICSRSGYLTFSNKQHLLRGKVLNRYAIILSSQPK